VSIDQGIGSVQNAGARRAFPSDSTTYTLTAKGPGGVVTASASVSVTSPPAPVVVEPSLRAGATKVNAKDGLTYVWIPPGTFQMGCSPGDTECDSDEKPPHKVTITKGFWLGQTEVTQEAWQRVMRTDPSNFKGAKLPVENITWNDAKSYCQAAGMRLPTEAEWEYAARAGSTASRYGNLDGIAWYSANSGSKTHDVGGKQANAWGLQDMLGNVWEWVADWYANYPPGDATDPQGPASGTERALRGGSWVDGARVARVSFRLRVEPAYHAVNFGFRCGGN
jgi:formylglycine-generating enzyme required for sulfatase activity